MPGQDDLRAYFRGPLHHGVEVVHLEPEQYAVSVGSVVPVADRTMMMVHVETVQLKDKLAVRDEPLVLRSAMIAPATQQPLIPPAARFHIGHCNKRLRTHLTLA